MMSLEKELSGKSTNLAAPFEQISRTVTKRGLVVLISDLLAPVDTLSQHLGYLRMRGHEVIVIRVLDESERELKLDKPAMFHDMESGRDLYIDPETARTQYLQKFTEHENSIIKMCANYGIDFTPVVTSQAMELVLFDFIRSRMHRGKRVIRRGDINVGGAA
jgi:uncharacterized protein (DUF58 family)